MAKNTFHHYFFIAIFLGVMWLMLKLLMPFMTPVILAAVLVFAFYPVYKWMLKRMKNKTATGLVMTFLILLVVVLPALGVLGGIFNQAFSLYSTVRETTAGSSLIGNIMACDETNMFCRLSLNALQMLTQDNGYLPAVLEKMSNYIVEQGTDIVKGVGSLIISLLIMVISMYYLFKDGKKLADFLDKLMPMKKVYRDRVLKQFKDIIHAVVYGTLLIALLQAIAGTIGLLLLNAFFGANIPSPLLWGVVMGLLAFIPMVGASIVWIIIAIILLALGNYAAGIVLIIYGALVISMIENILKPKVIGNRARLNPLLIILSVFGGLTLFGFIGIILGPMVAALFILFADIYKIEFK